MKRISILTVALLVSIMGISTISASAANRPTVKTKTSLKYTPAPNEYDFASFSGTVKAKKGCASERKVKVGAAGERKIGTMTTDRRGRFEVTAGSEARAGRYIARVKKATVTKGKKKIACQAAKSRVVVVS